MTTPSAQLHGPGTSYVRTLGQLTYQARSPSGTEEAPRFLMLTSRADQRSVVSQEIVRD